MSITVDEMISPVFYQVLAYAAAILTALFVFGGFVYLLSKLYFKIRDLYKRKADDKKKEDHE